jgi:hypothetical protein
MYCDTGAGYRDCLSLWNSESDPKYYRATMCNRSKSSYLLNPKLAMKHAVSLLHQRLHFRPDRGLPQMVS